MSKEMLSRLYHKQTLKNVLLAVVSGVVLTLAFPKLAFYPLAWVGLVPLLMAVRRTTPLGSFFLGWLTGFVFFAGLLYWIGLFGVLPWLMLALKEGLAIAVFAIVANVILSRCNLAIIALPAVWTALEYVRTLGIFGFTWGDLAYSQVKWLPFVQLAALTGSWGISFLIVLWNVAAAELIYTRSFAARLYVAATALLVLITAIGGQMAISRINKDGQQPDMSVALVQSGIELTWADDERVLESHEAYSRMTKSLGSNSCFDLIVWPESAIAGDFKASAILQNEMLSLAEYAQSYLLAGGLSRIIDDNAPGGFREYNSAYMMSPDGQFVSEHSKVRLVPFGEFVPGRGWLPFLDHYRVNDFDRYPGAGYIPIRTPFGDLGVMICFESTFPYIGRTYVNEGAELLVVITNDSWFKQTAAAAQHADFSVLRAIEMRRYVARAATTGISCLVTPTGEVQVRADLDEEALVEGKLAMLHDKTLYALWGDWFVWVSVLVGLICLLRAVLVQSCVKGRSC